MASDIRAGRAFVEILARDKLNGMLPRILNSAAGKLRAYSNIFGAAGAMLAGGAVGAIGGLTAVASRFATAGDAVAKMADRTGMSTEAISELSYAAGLSGTTLQAVEKGAQKLARGITDAADGSQTARDAFASLGMSWSELAGMSPDEQFEALADGVAGIEDPTRRAAIAQRLLGEEGSQLIPLLAGGAEGLRQMRAEAAAAGHTMSAETAAQAARLADALGSLRSAVDAAWIKIGAGLAPVITTMANALRQGLIPINAFVEKHQDLMIVAVPAAAAIAGIGVSLLAVAGVLRLGAFTLGTFAGAASRLGGLGSSLARPFTAGLAAAQRFGVGLATATVAGVRTAAAHLGTIPQRVGRVAIAGAAAGARIGAGIAAGLVRIGPTLRAAVNPAVWSGLVAGSARAAMRVVTNWRAASASLQASIGSAVSAGISRFAALGAAASRAAFRGAGRGIGAGIGGALGAAGGIAMLGTMLPGVAGGIASAVAGVAMLGPLVVGLVNPATILIGLIGGGVYAWTRWSDSGRNALQSVSSFFAPLLQTAKQTWGGIVDAFKAGNLSLAGQIALAGLRVVFLEGLQQITALFPQALGPLGDWLSKMGAQLAAGRWAELGATAMAGLRAAFDAGVAGLRGLWGNLVSGMVNAMAAGARAVADLWGKAVAGIGNSILSLASSNAAMGKLLAPVLGVDMYQERQRAETMEPQRRANMAAALTRNIETARRGLAGEATAEELAAMNVHAGMTPDEVRGHLQQALQAWEGELAALGGPMPDFLSGARDSVDRSLDEANQRIDQALNAWTDTAEAQAAETAGAARDELAEAMASLSGTAAGGAGDLSETMEAARQQLAASLVQATAEREEAARRAKAGQEAGDDELASSGKSFATFSSVSLAQQIGVKSLDAEQLAKQTQLVELTRQNNQVAVETQRVLRQRQTLVYGA